MARKGIHIFKMTHHYSRLVVYHGSYTFKNLVGTTTVTPDKGLTRRERYDVLAAELFKGFGIPAPSYRPLKRESLRKR